MVFYWYVIAFEVMALKHTGERTGWRGQERLWAGNANESSESPNLATTEKMPRILNARNLLFHLSRRIH
jgi:hypothetical protein